MRKLSCGCVVKIEGYTRMCAGAAELFTLLRQADDEDQESTWNFIRDRLIEHGTKA